MANIIESLKSQLEALESEMTVATKPIMARAAVLKQELRSAYFEVFDTDATLRAAISRLESSPEYGGDSDGIYAWTRYDADTSDVDAMDALRVYLDEQYCIRLDAENDALIQHYGDEELIIQDDTRRDNGVWQGHKLVIAESDYLDDDGQVDESKRNALIEAHMERTGYFPGVFRLTQHGDVFPVSTQAPKVVSNG